MLVSQNSLTHLSFQSDFSLRLPTHPEDMLKFTWLQGGSEVEVELKSLQSRNCRVAATSDLVLVELLSVWICGVEDMIPVVKSFSSLLVLQLCLRLEIWASQLRDHTLRNITETPFTVFCQLPNNFPTAGRN